MLCLIKCDSAEMMAVIEMKMRDSGTCNIHYTALQLQYLLLMESRWRMGDFFALLFPSLFAMSHIEAD